MLESSSKKRRLASHLRACVLAALCALPAAAHAQGTAVEPTAVRAGRSSVQPGDRVVVRVYREPLLSDTVMVTGEGQLVLARIGAVDASSLTIAVLADTIRARYGRFLRNPAVDLVVLRRISVNGEVKKPGVYYVDVSMTLRDVIALAEGITAEGSDTRVDIVRRGQRTPVPNWQDDFTLASDLMSGDQVVVGKRPWFSRNLFSLVSSAAVLISVVVSLSR